MIVSHTICRVGSCDKGCTESCKRAVAVVQFPVNRQPLADLADEIKTILRHRRPVLGLAEAIGVLEIVKLELHQEVSE